MLLADREILNTSTSTAQPTLHKQVSLFSPHFPCTTPYLTSWHILFFLAFLFSSFLFSFLFFPLFFNFFCFLSYLKKKKKEKTCTPMVLQLKPDHRTRIALCACVRNGTEIGCIVGPYYFPSLLFLLPFHPSLPPPSSPLHSIFTTAAAPNQVRFQFNPSTYRVTFPQPHLLQTPRISNPCPVSFPTSLLLDYFRSRF